MKNFVMTSITKHLLNLRDLIDIWSHKIITLMVLRIKNGILFTFNFHPTRNLVLTCFLISSTILRIMVIAEMINLRWIEENQYLIRLSIQVSFKMIFTL